MESISKQNLKSYFVGLADKKNIKFDAFFHIESISKSIDYIEETKRNFYSLSDKNGVIYLNSELKEIMNFFKTLKELSDKYKIFNEIDNFLLFPEIISFKLNELINLNDSYLKKSDEKEDLTNILDLSNTKGTEKIIYLNELGILDFLREKQPFNMSVNSLATILSAITGEKTTTLQPYLNPLINKGIEQDKNPYNSKKTVDKVKNLLINIGFTPK